MFPFLILNRICSRGLDTSTLLSPAMCDKSKCSTQQPSYVTQVSCEIVSGIVPATWIILIIQFIQIGLGGTGRSRAGSAEQLERNFFAKMLASSKVILTHSPFLWEPYPDLCSRMHSAQAGPPD